MAKKARSPRAKRSVRAKTRSKTRRATRPARQKPAARSRAPKRAARPKAKSVRRPARAASKPSPRRSAKPPKAAPAARPRLERDRRRLADAERLAPSKPGSDARLMGSVRAGRADLKAQLRQHTESSPALTAGDVDAKWQDAYAEGDEDPGGDNPTPEQNRVDEIGKALGVEYDDNEELEGGDEILERDEHRWELDPASSDDWPHKDED